MSWQNAIIFNSNEHVLHSWKGDCERRFQTVVPQKGLIGTRYVSKDAKQRTSGELVLTNQRLLWLERRGMLSKTHRASFEIDLKELQGIASGGAISKWVSITDSNGENVFHLHGVGKKEIEPFRDMIIRQVEKLRETTPEETTTKEAIIQKEIVTRQVVMVQCSHCDGLMPQTSTFCPNCGAPRRR